MNELERIVRTVDGELAERPYLLATVVRVSGSSYRRPGARMLVAGERWLAGCVSGGCLEGDVMLRGAHRCKDGPVVVTYDSASEDSEAWQVGLGCGGVVDVLLEHVPAGGTHDAIAFARACFAAERAGTLVTVIASTRAGAPVGARLGVGPDVAFTRPVTDAEVARALAGAARGTPGVVRIDAVGVTALVEAIATSPRLFVFGSGHDAAPLAALATSIGLRVTVCDRAIREPSRFLGVDRTLSAPAGYAGLAAEIDAAPEAYVVIMHHQRDADRDALAAALASRARYIGVLGPERRTRELLAELGHAAGDPRLHAPIGLDLGAETPEQIAVAITGEIQAVMRRRPAVRLRDRARALHAELAVAVLAAGESRRLGRPKQLVTVGGAPLIRRVVETCIDAAVGPVAIVIGAHADAVDAAVGDLRVTRIENASWAEGIGASIRAAVRWAETTGASGVLLVLGDQPHLRVDHVAALREAWLDGASRVASRYGDGVLGAPAVFDRSRFAELAGLDGDHGAGRLLRTGDVVALDWPDGAIDVDTESDVDALDRQL